MSNPKTARAAKAAPKPKAVPMKAWQKTQQTKITDHGSLKSFFPKGTKLSLISRNMRNKSKQVTFKCVTLEGDTYYLTCSKQVSDLVRGNEITKEELVGLPVISFEQLDKETGKLEETFRISLPEDAESDNTNEFSLDDVEAEEIEISSDWAPENFRTF